MRSLRYAALHHRGLHEHLQDTLEGGYKANAESTRKPPEVASCIIERAQSQSPWRATQRPLGADNAIEVVITSGGEGVAAVAHVRPRLRFNDRDLAYGTAPSSRGTSGTSSSSRGC